MVQQNWRKYIEKIIFSTFYCSIFSILLVLDNNIRLGLFTIRLELVGDIDLVDPFI
jgi:hypothetical protein